MASDGTLTGLLQHLRRQQHAWRLAGRPDLADTCHLRVEAPRMTVLIAWGLAAPILAAGWATAVGHVKRRGGRRG